MRMPMQQLVLSPCAAQCRCLPQCRCCHRAGCCLRAGCCHRDCTAESKPTATPTGALPQMVAEAHHAPSSPTARLAVSPNMQACPHLMGHTAGRAPASPGLPTLCTSAGAAASLAGRPPLGPARAGQVGGRGGWHGTAPASLLAVRLVLDLEQRASQPCGGNRDPRQAAYACVLDGGLPWLFVHWQLRLASHARH